MFGDIKLNVGSDLVRSLGCNDLTTGKKFTLLLGTHTNMLSYSFPDSGLTVHVKITTDGSFAILINQLPICELSQDVTLCSQPIDMNLQLIMNVKSPVNKLDAVNKAYHDCIKLKTTTGVILIITMTDHTLFKFPAAKAFASGKIKICGLNGWQMSRLQHQIQWAQLRGLAFTGFLEVRPLSHSSLLPRQWLDLKFSPRLYRSAMSQFK